MAFTVVGPDHFLGSGHPDVRQMQEEGMPPHLGLIESTNAGRSWRPVSLLGEADFHVLRVDRERVLGLNTGLLMISSDRGRTWSTVDAPVELVDIVVAPGERSRMVASGADGLYGSFDGGRVWRRLGDAVGLLAWPAANALYLVSADGSVSVSGDGGRTFELRSRVAQPSAFLAVDATTLYVALHDSSVLISRDGGRTWASRMRAAA
jgi:photosystem II stability/assembly factor-like uncharacterized protein